MAFTTTDKEIAPVWSVAIADIRELKKIGGLGWKGKLVVSWSTGKVLFSLKITSPMGIQYVC